jgi:hypothetical protein
VPRDWHSAKFEFLPRARAKHSAKKPFFKKIFLKIVFVEWYHLALSKIDLFAECQGCGTQQSWILCPVLALGKTGKFAFFVCCFPSTLTRKTHI